MVSPSFGELLFTVLVVIKFELVTVILSLKSSCVRLLSVWFCVLATIFVKVFPPVPASTVALIANVAVAPLFKVPIAQLFGVQLPELVVPFKYVNPVGSVFTIFKLPTWVGPLFKAVIVNVTVSPTFGVLLSTVFVNTISASFPTVMLTLAELFAKLESEKVALAFVVVFVITEPPVPALTVVVMYKVAISFLDKSPIFQRPVKLLNVP